MLFKRYNESDDKRSKFVHEPRNKHEEMERRLEHMQPHSFMRSFDLEIIQKMLGSLYHFRR